MLTDTFVGSTGIGSILAGPLVSQNTTQPADNSLDSGAVDRAYDATPYNNTLHAPETIHDKPRQDFSDALEQQINKNTQRDSLPKDNTRVNDEKPLDVAVSNQSDAQVSGRSQELTPNRGESSSDESKDSAVQIKTGSVGLTTGVTLASKKTPIVTATASSTTLKQAKPIQEALEQGQAAGKGEKTAVTTGAALNTKAHLQKTDQTKASASKEALVVQKSSGGTEISKENGQSSAQNSKVTSDSLETEGSGRSVVTKQADSSGATASQSNVVSTVGKDVIPQTKHSEGQSKEDSSAGEKHSSAKDESKGSGNESSSSLRTEGEQSESSTNTAIGNYVAQKHAAAESQATSFQSQISKAVDMKGDDKTGPDQATGQNISQSFGSDSAAPITQVGKSASSNPLPSNPTNVADQVQESFNTAVRQGDQQITIRLNPPELGSVRITIKQEDQQITGLLEVSELQTRAEIQQTLPQIVRNLQDMGIQVKRLDVAPSNDQNHHASMGQSSAGQEGKWSDSEGSGSSGLMADDSDWSGATEWASGAGGYVRGQEGNRSFFTDSAINMLV